MERNVSDGELSSKGTCTEGLWDTYTYAEELWKPRTHTQRGCGNGTVGSGKVLEAILLQVRPGPVQSKFYLSSSCVCQIIRAHLSGCGKEPQTLGLQQADLRWLS